MTPHVEPTVRLARPADEAEIGSVYAVCMPTSVWGRLGTGVAEVYFRRFCTGPHEVGVTAWQDGVLVGTCLGTGRPDVFRRRFYMENAVPLAVALAREVMRRPSVLTVLARRVAWGVGRRLAAAATMARGRAPRTERFDNDLPLEAPCMCYMSDFFVLPSARGRQLGTVMLRLFAEEMANRGFEWCRVNATVDNVASQTAQRRAGFECVARRGDNLTFVRRIGAGTG